MKAIRIMVKITAGFFAILAGLLAIVFSIITGMARKIR